MKKTLLIIAVCVLVILTGTALYLWKTFQMYMNMQTISRDAQLTVYAGGGGNSIVLTSPDNTEALVVDTKMGSSARDLRKKITAKEIVIVNTHLHTDHTGGNSLYPHARIISGSYSREQWESSSQKNRYPDETLRPGQEKVIRIGPEKVHIRNMGQAHTWNDMVVYLENRKLLVTGDIIFIDMHPALFASGGTSVKEWIKALDKLIRLYPVQTLVPGHGPVADQKALVAMKDYFNTVNEAVKDPVKREAARQKYKDYFSIPRMSSFENTLAFIVSERKIVK